MKNISTIAILNFILISIGLGSCKKELINQVELPNTSLTIEISHEVNGILLEFDSILYQNSSESPYSVSRLEYYISGIKLYKEDSTFLHSDATYYINARNKENKLLVQHVVEGDYTAIEFLIGIAADKNISNSLENTTENINMQWPDVIGGGYHFLKLEGRYLDTAGVNLGYTMHVGTNEMLIKHRKLNINIHIQKEKPAILNCIMNVNEWFQNPHTYNFNVDGNYTMAIPALMQHLKNNGYDTFLIQN
ncbi:MAG: hypothetical protein MH472_01470 [Bacteroidia bacterium]|nr:hypothetical protein [Bacteroidia bacterium]